MGQNVQKVYTISIQMDAAQQKLADAIKKLQTLDQQLEGLDRDSEAGKKLVEQMGAAAAEVEKLQGQVGGLAGELDALKPGTIGALRQEVRDLTAQLNLATEGTAEYEEILVKLGAAKGGIRGLRDDINSLNPEKQIIAFTNFASGVVGAFGICQVAAESFGLQSSTADEFIKKTQGVISVLASLEAVRSALDNDTTASIKNTLKLAKSYITAGEGASTGAKVTRAALISTGIGLLIVGVALLIANWDKLTSTVKGSEAFFTKVKAVASGLFDSAIASVKNFAGVIGKVFEGDFSGAAAKAKSIGKEVGAAYTKGFQESIFESHRKEMEALVEAHARQIEVLKSQGQNTFKQEEQNLLAKLRLQKQGTEDEKNQYLNLQKDLAVLRAANAKKEREDSQAATLARLDARIALEQAKGEEAFQKQLAREKKQLAILQNAPDPNAAAIINQQSKIATLIAQHQAEQDEKRRAALVLAQQNELALLEKQGKDTLALRVTFAEQLVSLDHDGSEKQRTQREADYQALLLVEEEYNTKVREGLQANQAQRQELAEQGREADRKFIEGTADYLTDAANKSLQKSQGVDVGRTILTKFFGIKSEDVEKVKAEMNQAFTEIAQNVTGIVNAMLASGINEAQAQIDAAQARLQELDNQLSAVSGQRQADENSLQTAVGARREYLVSKIAKEAAAEQKLAGERAKAAREAEAAAKEKAKLEKEQQQISAASTAIEAVLLGIKAAQTLVDIADKGKFGVDNIVLAIAAATTLGAGIFAMKNAAKSFESGTGALGGDGLLRGPRHAQGGVGLFSRYGHFFGEAEGGEAITPVDASINNANALALIRTKGRTKQLTAADFAELGTTRVLPSPSGAHYANGTGALGAGRAAGPGQVVIAAADLSDILETNRALLGTNQQMLAHLQAINGATTATAAKPPLIIGHEEALRFRGLADEADQSQDAATL